MITHIVVHCSASPQGRGDNAETIHKWHQERGFDGIGYHKVILEDGTVENGRPEYWQGAHARQYNRYSLGVCFIGEGGDATTAQLQSLADVVLAWKKKHPEARVVGHSDLDPNKPDCPGFNVPIWWVTIE